MIIKSIVVGCFFLTPPPFRLTGVECDDLVVLSNGDPVLFDKIKSKEEAENLGAWIHHLLGVEAHEMVEEEEVKVKEIVEDILNESVDLLAEAEEEDNHEKNSISLLEEGNDMYNRVVHKLNVVTSGGYPAIKKDSVASHKCN